MKRLRAFSCRVRCLLAGDRDTAATHVHARLIPRATPPAHARSPPLQLAFKFCRLVKANRKVSSKRKTACMLHETCLGLHGSKN